MDLAVHIVTKNNEKTIQKTIQSILPLQPTILIADIGSKDRTIPICESLGCKVSRHPFGNDYSEIRNNLISRTTNEWILSLNPWEALIQGHRDIINASKASYYLSVIQGTILSKEVRFWRREAGYRFTQPVYEYLQSPTENEMNAVIYSGGGSDYHDNLAIVEAWKAEKPTAPEPHYYQALTLLALKRYEEFQVASQYYMFLDSKPSVSTVMNRYYYALVQVLKGKVRPALQNINLCLSARPLMAELWCLIGDVYYHHMNNAWAAKEFYENAILLGSRRLKGDKWPMDISKYHDYPSEMIEHCKKVISEG